MLVVGYLAPLRDLARYVSCCWWDLARGAGSHCCDGCGSGCSLLCRVVPCCTATGIRMSEDSARTATAWQRVSGGCSCPIQTVAFWEGDRLHDATVVVPGEGGGGAYVRLNWRCCAANVVIFPTFFCCPLAGSCSCSARLIEATPVPQAVKSPALRTRSDNGTSAGRCCRFCGGARMIGGKGHISSTLKQSGPSKGGC